MTARQLSLLRTLHRKTLLDFGEDDVNVCGGDILAVNDETVLADLGKILAVHLLPRRLAVTMNGKLVEGRLHL